MRAVHASCQCQSWMHEGHEERWGACLVYGTAHSLTRCCPSAHAHIESRRQMRNAREKQAVSEMVYGEWECEDETPRERARCEGHWEENADAEESELDWEGSVRRTDLERESEDEQGACWREECVFWAACGRKSGKTPETHWRLACTEPQTDRSAVWKASIVPTPVRLDARNGISHLFADTLAIRQRATLLHRY